MVPPTLCGLVWTLIGSTERKGGMDAFMHYNVGHKKRRGNRRVLYVDKTCRKSHAQPQAFIRRHRIRLYRTMEYYFVLVLPDWSFRNMSRFPTWAVSAVWSVRMRKRSIIPYSVVRHRPAVYCFWNKKVHVSVEAACNETAASSCLHCRKLLLSFTAGHGRLQKCLHTLEACLFMDGCLYWWSRVC